MNKKPSCRCLDGRCAGGVGGGLLVQAVRLPNRRKMLAAQEAGLGQLGSLGWGGATTGTQGMINSATSGGLALIPQGMP